MFAAWFIRRAPSASTSCVIRAASARIFSASAAASASARTAAPRSAEAAFSACAETLSRSASRSAFCAASISSICFRRSAMTVSRIETTLSVASTDFDRAPSAAASASDWAFDFSAMAMARSCSSNQEAPALDLQRLDLLLAVDPLLLEPRSYPLRVRIRIPRANLAPSVDPSGPRGPPRRAAGRAASPPRAPAPGGRIRSPGQFRATAFPTRGSCCGSGSGCPARCRSASSCRDRSAR